MSNLIEAKQAICGCTDKDQVLYVAKLFCGDSRFNYSEDLSLMDNAMMASRQDKHKVAEVLSFAAKRWERL